METGAPSAPSASSASSAETVLPSCSSAGAADAVDSSFASLREDSKDDDGDEDVSADAEGIVNDDEEYELFTIKTGWRQLVQITGAERTRFMEAVQDTVDEMRRLSCDILLFANYYLLRCLEEDRRPVEDFGSEQLETFFYRLGRMVSTSRGKAAVAEDTFLNCCRQTYLRMRSGARLANRDYKGRQLHALSKQLATATKNHFTTNVYRRLHRWVDYKVEQIAGTLTTAERKDVVKRILNDIAGKEVYNASNRQIGMFVNSVRRKLAQHGVGTAANRFTAVQIRRNLRAWIHMLHEIGKDFAEIIDTDPGRGVRAFSLLPLSSLKTGHVTIDRASTFLDLLRLSELVGSTERGAWNQEAAEEWHRKLFRVADKETMRSTYAYHLRTDGIAVSLTMKRPIRARAPSSSDSRSDSSEVGPEDMEFQGGLDVDGKRVVAVDPGRRVLFSAVDRDGKQQRCSTREYRERIGARRRQKQVEKWLDKAQLRVKVEGMPSARVMASALLTRHIQYLFRNSLFDKLLKFYGSVRYRKLVQNGFYARNRVLDLLVRRLTDGQPTVVAYGSADIGSCRRGSPPVGAKFFRAHCRKRTTTVLIDEFYTSQVCPKCNHRSLEQMKAKVRDKETGERTRKSLWPIKVCNDCHTVWNR